MAWGGYFGACDFLSVKYELTCVEFFVKKLTSNKSNDLNANTICSAYFRTSFPNSKCYLSLLILIVIH